MVRKILRRKKTRGREENQRWAHGFWRFSRKGEELKGPTVFFLEMSFPMYGCYGFPVHLYYHCSSSSPLVAWALFVCLVVDNRGHMWVLLISSLFICLLLLFYWLFFLALFEFGKALYDIPLSGDIDYIFVLDLLLVYLLVSKPTEKIMRCGFVWLFNLHLPLLCFSWFILCSCISFLFSFLVYVSYCATTCASLLGDLGCGWHWQ